ncbi:hypothetical protein Pla52n_69530 [Stieleria varia]|uniref:Uncharacterized protein n=1 Tax=Stieleria varia TaxID=2528005 RepID=A0A5C5ZKI7_9BACT|nr:hypothetical protein Pla52n_69530 [Stieleria varia]
MGSALTVAFPSSSVYVYDPSELTCREPKTVLNAAPTLPDDPLMAETVKTPPKGSESIPDPSSSDMTFPVAVGDVFSVTEPLLLVAVGGPLTVTLITPVSVAPRVSVTV